MKTSGTKIRKLAAVFALAFCLTINLHAQQMTMPVQSAVPDSIIQITADAAGLNQLDPSSLPRSGTFLVIVPDYRGGITALPYPGMTPALAGLPVYGVTANSFIVDDMNGQIFASPPRAGRLTANISVGAALELQANATLNLINTLQGAQLQTMSRAMGLDVPSFNDTGNGGTNNYSPSFDLTLLTNGLWLQITNYDGNFAYANLNNATDRVYAVWTATNLSTGWQVAAELWPTPAQTNVLPFTVPTSGQPILFLRAQDWTGVMENGNTTPDWWFWNYFGTTALSDTNQDANGNSLLSDYTNNWAPAAFTFSGVQVPNNYVSTTPATVQLNVTGSPYYMAVLVDDPNFNDAVWTNYTSPNVAVSLWPQGWHDIWIGLRGHADAASAAVWQWRRLKLDYTPPALVITGPTSGTVNIPMIQLTGYSAKALSSISYDLSNTAGTVTNQLAVITGQSYNTGTMEFATNYFQCYDVPLTNGVNTFTLHATDLAGNISTLATNITLDYSGKTNPPAVALLWPLDGMEICGSNIVCRGQVSDQTVSVAVQLVDANGATNSAGSLVGRDGIFYADNLTLAAGTNYLSYTLTDAAGNVSSTNITVTTSTLGLTLNPVVAGQTLVTGTIDDDSYTVYVNGVQATKDGSGGWSATITPIGIGGGAVLVNAINDGDPSLQQIVQPPQGVFMSAYHHHETNDYFIDSYGLPYPYGRPFEVTDNLDWQDGGGGQEQLVLINSGAGGFAVLMGFEWPTNNWPQALPVSAMTVIHWNDPTDYPNSPGSTNYWTGGQPSLRLEHCDIFTNNGSVGDRRVADTEVKLATGGPPGSTQKNLWVITATATNANTGKPIPPEQIQIGSFGNLDTNGNLYVMLPDNDPEVITPMVAGIFNYFFSTPVAQNVTKTLFISVDTSAPAPGVPSTFNAKEIGSSLGTQLTAQLALPKGAIKAQVHLERVFNGSLGWNAGGNVYVCRVNWDTQLAGGGLSTGGHNHVTIDPIACRNYNAGSDPKTQFWVNDLAHEVVWGNVCGGNDHDLDPPAGEISSGLEPPLTAGFTISNPNIVFVESKLGF